MPMEIKHENLIGTFEQKREQVRQFNLMHDDFFAVVMRNKKAIQTVLRILLKKKSLKVIEVRVQYAMRNLIGHSAVLDVLAEDNNGKLYNVEVQVKNADDYQKRTRYYQASMDTAFLNKGKHYKELPDLYLIFITAFDIFGENKVCYEVERVLKGFNRIVDNGVHELYFNANVVDGTETSDLLQFFMHTDENNNQFGDLSKIVKHFKITEEGVNIVCDEVRKYGDQRVADAERTAAADKLSMITTLMKTRKITLEEALESTGISMEKYLSWIEMLNERKSA